MRSEQSAWRAVASGLTLGWLVLWLLPGCERDRGELVLYTSIDEPYARQIIDEFTQRTGIRVNLVTDAEASKSVGLAERLRAERDRPRANVWWGNEPFHTVRLAREGLLVRHESPEHGSILPRYVDAERRYAGNGLRSRVIIARQSVEGVSRLLDLLRPELQGRVAIARPTAGTTGGHVAAIYAVLGDPAADMFFRGLRDNGVMVLAGNGAIARAVAEGVADAGLTDNDDVAAVRSAGADVKQIVPDQENSFGTLLVPTTVGLVAGSESRDDARKLVDYLLSAGVESRLMALNFCNGSVRESGSIVGMAGELDKVAGRLPEAVARATAILDGRR
jgi:iron(III) transport system substrate-binding protein